MKLYLYTPNTFMEGDYQQLSPTYIGFKPSFYKGRSRENVLIFGVEEIQPAKLKINLNTASTVKSHLMYCL